MYFVVMADTGAGKRKRKELTKKTLLVIQQMERIVGFERI